MPRAKTRRMMRPNEREALAVGLTRRWTEGDNASTMADRFGTTKRRVAEALQESFREVQRLERKHGADCKKIAAESGLPEVFVAYAMNANAARSRDIRARQKRNRPNPYELATGSDDGVRRRAQGGPRKKRTPRPKTQIKSEVEKLARSLDDFLRLE